MKDLNGRVAVVTGAASGIGRATALELARAGCQLALADVNAAALDSVRTQAEALGARVSVHRVDVASEAEMRAFVSAVIAAHGGVNILINNAGVAATGTLEDQDLEAYRWLVGINFWGVVYGCKLFLPHLKRADAAHIVNISSMFGLTGVPTQSAYCATKFAVRGFTESLWLELHPYGIGVTSVHPGMIATNIVREGKMTAREERARAGAVARFAQGMPPRRAAQQIVKAIRKNRQRQLIGLEAHATDLLRRLLPAASIHLISLGYAAVSRRLRGEAPPAAEPEAESQSAGTQLLN